MLKVLRRSKNKKGGLSTSFLYPEPIHNPLKKAKKRKIKALIINR